MIESDPRGNPASRGPTARTPALFEYRDFEAVVLQLTSGYQAGDARADHGNAFATLLRDLDRL
jgi:hypothetical protein